MLVALALALCGHAARAGQQSPPPQPSQAQAELYERWRANIRVNERAAYEAGKAYAAQFPTDEFTTKYVRPWVAAYERAKRRAEFQRLLYKDKQYAAAYAVGQQVRADEPDNLKTLLDLTSAAYLATGAGDETVRADALALARQAVQALTTLQPPVSLPPFGSQPDALGYFNFVLGDLTLKTAPTEAAGYLRKAAQAGGALHSAPNVYARLAEAYYTGEYQPLSRAFNERFAGQEETPESRAALANIFPVLDRIIDAYARAVAYSQSDPQYNGARARWQQELMALYKSRHDGSVAGLDALVKQVINTPLPQPAAP